MKKTKESFFFCATKNKEENYKNEKWLWMNMNREEDSSHTEHLDAFFHPRSVAVIGASNKKDSLGNVTFSLFYHGPFAGDVYPVSVSSEEIQGVKAYRSVRDIPGDVDLAVIVIPARAVNPVMRECVEKGIPACVIITGGFSEVGEVEREQELRTIINESDIRVIGPNCVGIYVPATGVDTVFLPKEKMGRPPAGHIGLISQSGAFVSAVLDWFAAVGLGVSKVVSFGNKIDVNYSDLITYLSEDDETRVITIYMEGLEYGRMFMKAAREATKKTPIVILKAGRSRAGAAAAASHTGSLAGSDRVYDTAFKQSGIIRTYSSEELFDVSKAFLWQPLPSGARIAIITDGGGSGVMAADALEDRGLVLAPLQEHTKEHMRASFPPYCTVKNPIDLTGDADIERYEIALRAVLDDENVDAIVLIFLFQVPTLGDDAVERAVSLIQQGTKPVVVVAAGGTYTQKRVEELEAAGLPCYQTPERAVRAMGALCSHGAWRQKHSQR